MENNVYKSLYHGDLNLCGYKISCAVLEDGTRVLVNRSLANTLGIKGGGTYWKKKKGDGALLPEYLSAQYLQPYIPEPLKVKLLNPICYINKNGILTEGVPAELLADICDVYIKAGADGAFKENQSTPDIAYRLLLSFSKVGIIALVDEATGYQYEREQDELQKLWKLYISEELQPWQKRFPNIFYQELFRLNGWDYTVKGIQKRPSVIGKWTNTLIYEQLPKGVLENLKKNTPKSEAGNYTARFHQSLSVDVGEPHLNSQITKVITIFQLSNNMKEMWSLFNRLTRHENGEMELPFTFDDNGFTDENKPKQIRKTMLDKALKTALSELVKT